MVARVEAATLAEVTRLVARVEAATLAEVTLLVARIEAATLLVAQFEAATMEIEAEVLRTPEAQIVCPRVSNRVSPRMTDNGLPAIVHPPSATQIFAVSPVRLHHPPSEFVLL